MAETAQTRVWWRGVEITARQRDAFRTAEAWLQMKFKGVSLVPTQGSWADGKLSGGVHKGAGACDFRTWHYSERQRIYMIHCLKDAGQATWFRPEDWDDNGGDEHAHVLDRVTTNMNPGGVWQVQQFDAKPPRSGLTSNHIDPTYHPKPSVKWSYRLKRPVFG